MLVSLESIIPDAYLNGYAIGAFNVYNLESASAVIEAAEEMHSPVIIQTSEKALDYAGFENLTGLIIGMAKRSGVPTVVHLDHGPNLLLAERCLAAGYSSIMLDLSNLTYEQNVAQTKKIVEMAKRTGASVEAELGKVLGQEDDRKNLADDKTDPDLAAQFIQDTRITALAVAIGNAHGPNKVPEKLDFPLLAKIKQVTFFPLVLHGASGDSQSQINQAIKCGVVKINIDTELRQQFSTAVRQYLRANPSSYDPREIIGHGQKSIMLRVKQKIKMFGSDGKA